MVKRLSSTDQNNLSITNVPSPADGLDAVNRDYVDDAVSIKGDVFGPSDVGTYSIAFYANDTGKLLSWSGVSISPEDNRIIADGLTIDSIHANSIRSYDPDSTTLIVTNLATPTNDSDAATKSYVDNTKVQSMGVVNHGATASTARPSFTQVIWVGSVQPTNAIAGDAWWNNS